MNADINGGSIQINLIDLFENITVTDKMSLIDCISIDDEVINQVAKQILNDYTDCGSMGYTSAQCRADVKEGLDWARREIAKRSSEVVKKQIEDLEATIATHEKTINDLYLQLRATRKHYENRS